MDLQTADAEASRRQALLSFPGQQQRLLPTFTPNEEVSKATDEDCLIACRRLSVLYAAAGEKGFKEIGRIMNIADRDNYFSDSGIEVGYGDTVEWETMFRLFLTACPDLVPANALKAASHCGGIAPDGGKYITPFKECPASGEPGNHAYASLCKHLIDIYEAEEKMQPDLAQHIPWKLQTGKERFFQL